jgi:hypothetical protein
MRSLDVFASIPALLTSITIAAALGQSIFIMIVAIGVAGVPDLPAQFGRRFSPLEIRIMFWQETHWVEKILS